MPAPPFTCRLKHGVIFSANPGKAPADALVGFFAGAMQQLKELRDVRKADVYTDGPYKDYLSKGRSVVALGELSAPDDLPLQKWIEAVIDGYATADTLGQMRDEIDAWRAAAQKDGGRIKRVVELLEKKRDLEAFAVLLTSDQQGSAAGIG